MGNALCMGNGMRRSNANRGYASAAFSIGHSSGFS